MIDKAEELYHLADWAMGRKPRRVYILFEVKTDAPLTYLADSANWQSKEYLWKVARIQVIERKFRRQRRKK